MVVLAQQDSNGQADVARTRDSDVQFFECFHGFRSYDTNVLTLLYHEADEVASIDKQKHPSPAAYRRRKGVKLTD